MKAKIILEGNGRAKSREFVFDEIDVCTEARDTVTFVLRDGDGRNGGARLIVDRALLRSVISWKTILFL